MSPIGFANWLDGKVRSKAFQRVFETILGYAVFAVVILAIIAALTAIGAWWIRFAARRWFGFVPNERNEQDSKASGRSE